MPLQTKVYRDGGKLIHCTNDSPRQFNGTLFVCYEGDSPETVVESLHAINQFRDLEEVDASTLSACWRSALHLGEDSSSKNESKGSKRSVKRKRRNQSPTRTFEVIETKYVNVSPKMGLLSFNYYIGLGVFVTYLCGFKPWFIFLMMFLSLFALLYAWASMYLSGKKTYERPI
jgi:hypothetical protein